jgi:hypothetical protein
LADQRDQRAAERERAADERERLADERESRADERERLADEREHRLYELRGGSDPAHDPQARGRARAALDRASDRIEREEAAAGRDQAGWAREQSEIDRQVATSLPAGEGGKGVTPGPANRPTQGNPRTLEISQRLARGAREAADAAATRAAAARRRRETATRRLAALGIQAQQDPTQFMATERTSAALDGLEAARTHAQYALDRAIEAHSMSALAHERAADAAQAVDDVERAARHREAAARARAAAEHDRGVRAASSSARSDD